MDKKIKIAIIGYNLICGGAERNIINLSNYLNKKNGIESHIILLKNINEYKYEYSDIIGNLKIIYIYNTQKKFPKYLLPIKTIQILIKFFKIIKKNEYDLLIGAVGPYPYLITTFFAKLFKIKSILIFHHEEIQEKRNFSSKISHLLMKISFKLADRIICVSRGAKFQLTNIYNISSKKSIVIYNGIDVKRIKTKLKTVKYPHKKSDIIITIGRLVKHKGHIHLINAFKKVKSTYPNAKLIIIGKGKLENKLKNFIKKLKLEKDVTLLGTKYPLENPYKYLKISKVFVFPSLREGFGNVIIEAMSCGLPVIATDCFSGPREILCKEKPIYPYKPTNRTIKCKYGILIPPFYSKNSNDNRKKEAILAKTITELLEKKDLYNHYKKMSYLRANFFDIKIMGEGYYNLIKKVILDKDK